MNLNGMMFDPFDILSSFLKVHQSGSWHSFKQEQLIESIEEIAAAVDHRAIAGKPSDGYKGAIYDAVKENSGILRVYHGILKKWVRHYIESAQDISQEERQRALFWADQVINGASPSNFFWTNPLAVKRFLDSDGQSLVNGLKSCLNDIQDRELLVKISDPKSFKVGENLAYTPGEVVLRNGIMELIQYRAATKSTFSIPIIFLQPWINKYYIFDLTEENSFVRYLRDNQFTVFITSWRNPGPDMRNIDFEDYMFKGAIKAIEAARDICGADQVHVAGYCIGGTMLAALMAWLNQGGMKETLPVAHWTLFSTLVDFSNPGELGVFINEKIINTVESIMGKVGYLDKRYIAMAFRLLRSDSLIWHYFTHNYLQGGALPKSDVLYWNSDNTRLPEKMASLFLREFYLNNRLCQKDGLQLGGRPIDLGTISQPLYAVGALQDHIAPWKETYRTCQLIKGTSRYVITGDGHITGIVNPPSKYNRKRFQAGRVLKRGDADGWATKQKSHQGSWWPDWIKWLSNKCGPLILPPSTGNRNYPPVDKAPGSYVMER